MQFGAGRVLEQISGGPGLDRPDDVMVLVVGGEHDDADLRMLGGQAPDRRDAVEHRHAQVHEDDVGTVPADQGQRLPAVGGLGDHLQVRLGVEHAAQAVTDHRMVVGDEDPDAHVGTDTAIVVPEPRALSTCNSPPMAPTRSRIPASPNPPSWWGRGGWSKPTPSSSMSRVTPSSR